MIKPLIVLEIANNHMGDRRHGQKLIEQLGDVVDQYAEVFDFGLKFQASVDYSKSTCPQRLYNEGAYRGGQYDVSLRSDGTTAMYFSRTGKQFATGHHVEGSLNYRTPHACVWF